MRQQEMLTSVIQLCSHMHFPHSSCMTRRHYHHIPYNLMTAFTRPVKHFAAYTFRCIFWTITNFPVGYESFLSNNSLRFLGKFKIFSPVFKINCSANQYIAIKKCLTRRLRCRKRLESPTDLFLKS